MGQCILQMIDIHKSFPGVKALDGVSLNAYKGQVMALLGENGAGKSTLMKILSGVYSKDQGSIKYQDKLVEFSGPKDANDNGISIIHQELIMIRNMTIYENIFLGRELKNKYGLVDKKAMISKSKELLNSIGVEIDPTRNVSELSISMQQMVEITKALSLNAEIIIMDEPTDALPDNEVKNLFKIIQQLKEQNKAIIYISHRLNEVFEICDKATILRDGSFVSEENVSDLDESKLIMMMVGRSLDEQFPHINYESNELTLVVKNLRNKYVNNVSFELKSGEILGIAGLVGAGRTELAKTIYGLYQKESGTIELLGEEIAPKTPREAIDAGIYYISENRKEEGLVLTMDVKSNITISSLKKVLQFLRINKKEELKTCEFYQEKMNIRTPSLQQLMKNLSGGNQQKVVLSKGLMTQPDVLILDEPTRGVDVGAKKEIYDLVNELKVEGKSIIMISSEMPEILGMSDRILVMVDGAIQGELTREEASQEKIMQIIVANS